MIKIIVIIILLLCVIFSKVWRVYPLCNHKHIINSKKEEFVIDGTNHIYNPSLVKVGQSYIMAGRYSNRSQKNLFHSFYWVFSGFQSKIFFVLWSDAKKKKIIVPTIDDVFPLEDPRIIFHNGEFLVSATRYSDHRKIFPVLFVFDKEFNHIRTVEYNRDDYFGKEKHLPIQKNWCPFIYKNKLYLHTDSCPVWKVYEVSQTGRMKLVISYNTSKFFQGMNRVRCSTSWKRYTNTSYLCGLHTKSFFGTLPIMRSIFVEIDMETLKPLRCTDLLCFDDKEHSRIQFLSGLEIDQTTCHLTLGISDYKMLYIKITKNYMNILLKNGRSFL